jgi:hypothetical protein
MAAHFPGPDADMDGCRSREREVVLVVFSGSSCSGCGSMVGVWILPRCGGRRRGGPEAVEPVPSPVPVPPRPLGPASCCWETTTCFDLAGWAGILAAVFVGVAVVLFLVAGMGIAFAGAVAGFWRISGASLGMADWDLGTGLAARWSSCREVRSLLRHMLDAVER